MRRTPRVLSPPRDPLAKFQLSRTGSVTRRGFLKAGLLAAGSAFGASLLGCDSGGFVIPCLGPASAPAPVGGMTYIRASEIGCALNCDLRNGRNKYTGGTATDDGPRINAALAAATADNPITFIMDGSALVSGIFAPAGGHWNIAGLGCGTGFFVKRGTNNDGIHNGPPSANVPVDPGPPAPARGKNVSLSNFTLNGNKGNGQDGDSTMGIPQGTPKVWDFGINLMNLDNITIEKLVVVNTPAYHIRLSNVGNVSISGCVLISHGASTDGLHFDGPANDITISGCNITCDDDAIALNCPEGYTGNISQVAVSNCNFNSVSFMRLYTTSGGPGFTIDNVSVSNCKGYASEAAFLIGLAPGSLPNAVASLTVSNSSFTGPVVLGMAENFGNITLNSVRFNPAQSGVTWVGPQASRVCAFLRPSPLYGGIGFTGSNLSFNDCLICRYGDFDVCAVILENASILENVTFSGFGLQNTGAPSTVSDLLEIGSGSIGELVINRLDPASIAAPIPMYEFVSVGSVAGAGVLDTEWEFPNSVMADGVPFISAETGMPSIKLAGVVQTYPG